MRLAGLAPLLLLALAAAGGSPAPGPLRIIGAGTGCIAGARPLPPEGTGYSVIRAGQSSFWGAPNTLRGISPLAAEAQADGLPELYIGDISGPRGGPLAGGHVAHQRGLDVDIYLDTDPKPRLAPWQEENLTPPALVAPGSAVVDPSRWSSATITLIRLAAELPGLDRLLVNAAIKRQLCETVTGDRGWLRRVRPWWGHRAHMHLHFACPPGQPLCVNQAPVPPGDGCDASLAWWFPPSGGIQPLPPAGGPPPALPVACAAIIGRSAAPPPGAEAN
jgi:penicillin-insensitive murein DD-endopeptidase